VIASGCEISARWLAWISIVFASIRLAMKGCKSGLIVRSLVDTPHLERGALVRLVPQWYSGGGPISIYYASRTLLPSKTRVFVDFVVQAFKRDRLAERFAGSLG
jgi:DNA-binding transcriptional LysR family regulator